MKIKIVIFLLFIANGLIAMQPMQWIRDVTPAVKEELRTEDAAQATLELQILSQRFDDPGIARHQLIQKVDRLLKRGANPNAAYRYYPGLPERKITVISAAIQTDLPEVVELLLQAGADPDSPGYALPLIKDSVLFRAIEKNNERIVALLLQYGADPNFNTQPLEQTPLLQAVEQGNPAIVRLLLQAGADPKGGINQIRNALNRLKNLNPATRALLLNSNPDINLDAPPALSIAQKKLREAPNELDKQRYREIIQMLEHPEKVKRTGLEKKLTSEQYKLIEPALKGE